METWQPACSRQGATESTLRGRNYGVRRPHGRESSLGRRLRDATIGTGIIQSLFLTWRFFAKPRDSERRATRGNSPWGRPPLTFTSSYRNNHFVNGFQRRRRLQDRMQEKPTGAEAENASFIASIHQRMTEGYRVEGPPPPTKTPHGRRLCFLS